MRGDGMRRPIVLARASGKVASFVVLLAVTAVFAHADAAPASVPRDPVFRSVPIPRLVPGSRVLCLYDSAEGSSEKHNPLAGSVAAAVARMGFDVVWADAAGGLPPVSSLADVRAVVTGFVGSASTRAADHAAWVRAIVDSGRRFVVVGNYGAWQDRGSGRYLDADAVNVAFEALGVRYDGLWAESPEAFSVAVRDPRVARQGVRLDAARTRHFYQFSPVRADVRVLVGGTLTGRKDLPESALVFVSSTGAMALNRYLSTDDRLADADAWNLDVDAFVRSALAIGPTDPRTLLVIDDAASSDSRRALKTLEVASSYSGVPLVAVSLADARALRPADLASHAGIVLAVPDVRPPLDGFLAGLVRDHLVRGGNALALLPVRTPALAAVLGHRGGDAPDPVKVPGLRLLDGAYPGAAGLVIEGGELAFSGFAVDLAPACTVLAESTGTHGGRDRPVPLWWRCREGRGGLVALNAYELLDRTALGFVVQALVETEGTWAMPVIAADTTFIDDCPLPMSGNAYERMGGLKDTDFYLNEYYGMLREAARRTGMRPTFLAIFTYDDKVAPPFGRPFAGTTAEASLALARAILKDDFLVGIHGINHMSPGLSGGVTKTFPNREALAAYFRAARDAFAATYGPRYRPLVYVPPNDWIDPTARTVLGEVMPELQVVASVFYANEDETPQDFGPDPDVRGLVGLPRTWAGSFLDGDAMLGMVNGVLLQAVSTHFVHPDDILDPARNHGRTWPEMRAAFLSAHDEIARRFPFLRPMDAVQAGDEVRRIAVAGVAVGTAADGALSVSRASGMPPVTLQIRMPAGCGALGVRGGTVIASDPASGISFVRMEVATLTARCGDAPRTAGPGR